jgi:hypothetical protein
MGNLNQRAMRLFDRTRWQQRRAKHFSTRAFTRNNEDQVQAESDAAAKLQQKTGEDDAAPSEPRTS